MQSSFWSPLQEENTEGREGQVPNLFRRAALTTKGQHFDTVDNNLNASNLLREGANSFSCSPNCHSIVHGRLSDVMATISAVESQGYTHNANRSAAVDCARYTCTKKMPSHDHHGTKQRKISNKKVARQPQRGMGVAQLEKLRNLQELEALQSKLMFNSRPRPAIMETKHQITGTDSTNYPTLLCQNNNKWPDWKQGKSIQMNSVSSYFLSSNVSASNVICKVIDLPVATPPFMPKVELSSFQDTFNQHSNQAICHTLRRRCLHAGADGCLSVMSDNNLSSCSCSQLHFHGSSGSLMSNDPANPSSEALPKKGHCLSVLEDHTKHNTRAQEVGTTLSLRLGAPSSSNQYNREYANVHATQCVGKDFSNDPTSIQRINADPQAHALDLSLSLSSCNHNTSSCSNNPLASTRLAFRPQQQREEDQAQNDSHKQLTFARVKPAPRKVSCFSKFIHATFDDVCRTSPCNELHQHHRGHRDFSICHGQNENEHLDLTLKL